MLNTGGIFRKMMTFILLVSVPVAIVAIWLVSQELLSWEYSILLILTPVGPAVLIYNRLLREVNALSARLERETLSRHKSENIPALSRSGLLPIDDILLTMQQYRRVLHSLLKDANLQQKEITFLFDMLPDPILVLDPRRRIIRSNSAARSFFNVDAMDGDLASYLRHPRLIKTVDAALVGRVDGRAVEFPVSGAVSRQIAAYVVNLQEEGSDDLKVIVTLHDQTAAKKTEQMRVDFVANVSHELRTPLAILIGAVETLQGPASEDFKAYPRFLSMMQAQSHRMSQLIDDLLSLSQIEMNEHSRPSEPVDLSELLKSVIDMIGAKAVGLGKSVTMEGLDQSVIAIGDKDQLFQIFTNLVDNALKYGKENTPVVVSLVEKGQEITVTVIDQGEGISPEHLPRLTERFYRVDSNRSRQMGGTGLGLAIVKHIVSRHRGHLEISSVVGTGSQFSIRLPSATEKRAHFC